MFSNKKSIQNIENELYNMTTNTSDLINKSEDSKTVALCASSEGDPDSIYEFTFDPNEETPPPPKQTAARKKAKPKPKVIFVNNNYESNVLKTLQTLKNSLNRNSLEANNKENVYNESPEPVQQLNDEKCISPELKNTSTDGTKNKLKKESPSRREGALKDVSYENTSTVIATKHTKASPWRADFKEIPLREYNHQSNHLRETSKLETTAKITFSLRDTNSTVVENIEPKLKQPRLIDFIKQSSEKSVNLQKNPKDITLNSNKTQMLSKDQKMADEIIINPDTDSSVHLFEELEVIPSVKPCRRSYGKKEMSNPSIADKAHGSDSKLINFSEELSAISTCNKKAELKQTKMNEQKTQLTRQEEEEVNAWAEAFNSMCEDVDEFPLVVE